MNYVPFGRTGLKISPLCLGCLNFGPTTCKSESLDVIERAAELGINALDVADVYGGGENEQVVGWALRELGCRDRMIVATKFTGRFADSDSTDPNAEGASRLHIVRACESSLRRLGIDHIDLYQIHSPRYDVATDETLRALEDLVRAGKILYAGSSNDPAWKLIAAIHVAECSGGARLVSEQPPYNLLDRSVERELLPAAQSYDIAVIPWGPLANGMLTSKYNRDILPAGTRFSDRGQTDHFTDAAYRVVDVVAKLAATRGCTSSQLALAWCRRHPAITSIIIGPRNRAQLEDNFGSLKIELSANELATLDRVSPPGSSTIPYYLKTPKEWQPQLVR